MGPCLRVASEVRGALRDGQAVVALETAVLTHGLPRPRNREVLRAMEAAVREEGAVPAVVGVLGGVLHVGLGPGGVERLGGADPVSKAGVADLPALAAVGADAGTTVAATLWACRASGVRVFATGGLGGVHRGVGERFDVSGDLPALGRFGGCVVCSGVKAILDVPRTLQVLETLGVCVVGYGTAELPAFFCRSSGLPLGHRADSPEEAAAVVRCRDALGLPQAVVLANPPPEGASLEREAVERAVEEALRRLPASAGDAGSVTPVLLRAVAEITGGRTVEANEALLVANARLAARVALRLCAGPDAGPGSPGAGRVP